MHIAGSRRWAKWIVKTHAKRSRWHGRALEILRLKPVVTEVFF